MGFEKDTEKAGVSWGSFIVGMVMSAAMTLAALPLVGHTQTSQEPQEVVLDYERLEATADRIERAAKTIADTERAWEILAAKIVLDYEAQQASSQKPTPENNPYASFSRPVTSQSRFTPPPPVPDIPANSATVQGARVAENGSWHGQPNANGVAKTVYVQGYYRQDGTYVRGHYRSRPNSNP